MGFLFYKNVSDKNDNVTGYSLADIETHLLRDIIGINSLREKLKTRLPNNISNSDIDLLIP